MATTFVDLVQRSTLLKDTVQALVNSAGAFEIEYSVIFVYARTRDIVGETQSSDYLPTRCRWIYNQYMGFSKLFIENKKILDILEALSSERSGGKSLSISHVDILLVYVLERDDALLLVEVANFYVPNPT